MIRVEIKEEEGVFFTSHELSLNKKSLKVYWIYKESREEEAYFNSGGREHSTRCGKIFVMLGGCIELKRIFLINFL